MLCGELMREVDRKLAMMIMCDRTRLLLEQAYPLPA